MKNYKNEKKFQLVSHCVYLANSSGLKVGITHTNNQITRWTDQGAVQGILVAEVPNRRISGLIELELKKVMSDRTNWRKMLSGSPLKLDLIKEKNNYLQYIPHEFKKFVVEDNTVTEINYPVSIYPTKINSLNFEKNSVVEGELLGIKGQYLLFKENKVLNIRKHTGYKIRLDY